MLFVVAIWAVRYAVKSNQFEDLDNASQRIILDDRQERRQTMQAHENATSTQQANGSAATDTAGDKKNGTDTESVNPSNIDSNPKI